MDPKFIWHKNNNNFTDKMICLQVIILYFIYRYISQTDILPL